MMFSVGRAAATAAAMLVLAPVTLAFFAPVLSGTSVTTQNALRLPHSKASLLSSAPSIIRTRRGSGVRRTVRVGVGSLKAEVLPEGGVSPCVIKVSGGLLLLLRRACCFDAVLTRCNLLGDQRPHFRIRFRALPTLWGRMQQGFTSSDSYNNSSTVSMMV